MCLILVADDEDIELDCIIYLIKKYNFDFEIITAGDGREALNYIENKKIDILLTDIKMPFLDGLELSKKAVLLQPDLKIIIFSGFNEFEYAKEAILIGVKDYLLKPVDPAEFQEIMQKVSNEVALLKKKEDNKQFKYENKVTTVKQYIYDHYDQDLSLMDLASLVYINPDYLCRIFKKETGCGLIKFIKNYRMSEAKRLLEQTHMKITDISKKVGYRNVSYFCQSFREFYSISPEKYRQKDGEVQ